MSASRSVVAALIAAVSVASWGLVGAGQAGQLPLEPLGNRGEALFPYLEGWYTNDDGTTSFLLGYNNRNTKQTIEVPIGPNNRIEPGPADQGQPTFFDTGRQNRMFTITVPKDFGNKKLTWTLVANGITQAVTFWANPPYFVEPFLMTGTGNTPPVIKIDGGPELTGPPRGIAKTFAAAAGQPLTLAVWAADKPPTIVLDPNPPQRGADGGGAARGRGGRGGATGPPAIASIAWAKYRGPGAVKFGTEKLPITDRAGQTVTTTATFQQAGEYWLRVNATEGTGEGGSGQCCSTSALVKVNVK